MRIRIFILFVFIVTQNGLSVLAGKGPRLIYPSKNVFVQKIDPVFIWKYPF